MSSNHSSILGFQARARQHKIRLFGVAGLAVLTASAIFLPNATAATPMPVTNGVITMAPTNFQVIKADTTDHSVTLSWTAAAGTAAATTNYTVAWGTSSGAQTFRRTVSGTTMTTTISPLNSGRPYYFEGWADPAKAGGPHAGPIMATPLAATTTPPVNPPTGMTVTPANGYSANVSWKAVTNATFYTVAYSKVKNSQQFEMTTTKTSLNVGPLDPGMWYFEVWADPTKVGGLHAGPMGVTIASSPTAGATPVIPGAAATTAAAVPAAAATTAAAVPAAATTAIAAAAPAAAAAVPDLTTTAAATDPAALAVDPAAAATTAAAVPATATPVVAATPGAATATAASTASSLIIQLCAVEVSSGAATDVNTCGAMLGSLFGN